MKEYLVHIIHEGDRMDLIAYRYYKNAELIEPIFEANPSIPFVNTLDQFVGEKLYIPVIEDAENTVSKTEKKGLKALLKLKEDSNEPSG